MSEERTATSGISFLGALALLFIGLKLGGCIDWSWWYVLLPLWGPFGILLVAMIIVLLVVVIAALFDK
jgi:hypothetical protein